MTSLYFDINENQWPLIYDEKYNVSVCGLEKFHVFDAKKWRNIIQVLKEHTFCPYSFLLPDVTQPHLLTEGIQGTWKAYPNVSRGFEALYKGEYAECADPEIRKFVIAMYDRLCPSVTINECRKNFFTKKDKQIENLPPNYGGGRK